MYLLSKHYHQVFVYPDSEIIQSLLSKTGGDLIDFGCATGRVLELGVACGLRSIGIDDSEEMVTVGQSRLPQAEFLKGRYETLRPELVGRAGFVTILANTYSMMLDRRDRLSALKTAKEYLKPGGRFFIYIRTDSLSSVTERSRHIDLGDEQSLDFHIQWVEKAGVRTFTLGFTSNSRNERHVFPTAMIPYNDVIKEFIEAGFRVEESFGEFDRGPISPSSVHWFFILTPEKP